MGAPVLYAPVRAATTDNLVQAAVGTGHSLVALGYPSDSAALAEPLSVVTPATVIAPTTVFIRN